MKLFEKYKRDTLAFIQRIDERFRHEKRDNNK